MAKTALITGVGGQDGAYLARLLLDKGYRVVGFARRSTVDNLTRITDLVGERHDAGAACEIIYGDLTDGPSLYRLLADVRPDEIYNLAAQSHVHASFEAPEYTANVDGLGVLRLLEAMRTLGLEKSRFYQASTSELFGDAPPPQSEMTAFRPRSPYAAAKLYAYWTVRTYREGYGLHASNGILFNHESPLRGVDFVTRKISLAVARIANGDRTPLALGNLNAERDWGHARDYVEGMWRMLQQETPDDYVLATGEATTVRTFCDAAFQAAGLILAGEGSGIHKIGRDVATGDTLVCVNPTYFRPAEVERLCGDPSKAIQTLGWRPKTSVWELAAEMVSHDLGSDWEANAQESLVEGNAA
ncbi:MAG: GDP-mannose 4,6-dehydratase [Alphaproteobacteria bacterium]